MKQVLWLFVAILVGIFLSTSSLAQTYSPFPDTGQTKCYDYMKEISCPQPGQPFYGQDAHYQPRLPRSYTKLGLNGVELSADALHTDDGGPWMMTRDNVTGLIWEVKTNDNMDVKYTWQNAQDEFIAGMNSGSFGDFSDWRLPTVKELASLVDSSIYFPGPVVSSIFFPKTYEEHIFDNRGGPYYWASNSFHGNADQAWTLDLSYGASVRNGKSNQYRVRAVRGQEMQNSFVDNKDGTITDTLTGLMWQKCTYGRVWDGESCDGNVVLMRWEIALNAIENLTWAGYDDWRIPNKNELHTLIDYTRSFPALNPLFDFSTGCFGYYLASTTIVDFYEWSGWFEDGGINSTGGKSTNANVRAVRGPQHVATGSLQVIIDPEGARTAGAQWRREGESTWRYHEFIETNVPTGSQTVEFKTVSGYNIPANQNVTILESQTAQITGIYTSTAHTVTPYAGEGGSFSPNSPQSVNHGQTTTYTVTANSGNILNNGVDGTCPEGSWSGDVWTTGEVITDCTVIFSFSPLHTINLSASPVEGGMVAGSGEFIDASEVTITATANPGYTFIHWYEDGNVISTTPSYTFGVNESRNLMALFSAGYSGGDGTAENPYIIGTVTEMDNVRNHLSKNFILANCLDLGISPWNEGGGWVPIGTESSPFIGSFNGNGNIISNLFINRSGINNVGLFGVLGQSARINFLGLSRVNVLGQNNVGGITGQNLGSIELTHVDGEVIGTDSATNIGGLIGLNTGIISRSYSTAMVIGNAEVGGLVGASSGGLIIDCYATGPVGGRDSVGGLHGALEGGTINQSYATGVVVLADNSGNQGGLVGRADNNPSITSSYWNTETSLQSQSAGGIGLSTSQMRDSSSYSGWEFGPEKSWDRNDAINGGYPYLTFSILHLIEAEFLPENSGTMLWIGNYPHGSKATFEVVPGQGYTFEDISGCEGYRDDNIFTVEPVVKPCNILVTLRAVSEEYYELKVNKGFGSGNYKAGEIVAIEAIERKGFIFHRWVGNTEYVDKITSPHAKVVMPERKVVLTATFKRAR